MTTVQLDGLLRKAFESHVGSSQQPVTGLADLIGPDASAGARQLRAAAHAIPTAEGGTAAVRVRAQRDLARQCAPEARPAARRAGGEGCRKTLPRCRSVLPNLIWPCEIVDRVTIMCIDEYTAY